ncbi:MAG: hypothetical protein IPP83_01545 [Flavobacteriales bacterium]|nr:hypothetical protein [Flavobacteriales bacterium]
MISPKYWALRYRSLTVLALLVLFVQVDAQTTWRRTYGGSDSDQLRDVRLVDDDGYVMVGSTGSFGNGSGDMYLLRVNNVGELVWSRTFGDVAVQVGVGVVRTDNGFVVSGTTGNGEVGGYDIRLIGVDDQGSEQWRSDLGTSDWDLCGDIDGDAIGFAVAGTTYGRGAGSGDALIIRTDLFGDTIWTRTFGTVGEDIGLGVDLMANGRSFRVVGTEQENAFVAAFDMNGSPLWSTILGGDSADYLSSVIELPGSGYACVGGTRSYSNVLQVWLVGLEEDGGFSWDQRFGSGGDTRMERIERRPDGGIAMVGYNSAFNAGGKDMFLILTDASGGFQLGKNYGGSDDEVGFGFRCTPDGGFIMVGSTNTYGPVICRAGSMRRDNGR